jgi:hypothetical protein
MVRKYLFLALFLIPGVAIMTSCKKEELSPKKEILALIFEASKNANFDKNVVADIEGTVVAAEVPFFADMTQLVPTIEISPRATINPLAGVITDFSVPMTYTVTAEDGTTKDFTTDITHAPAPYLGTWEGGPINFGEGLMDVTFIADAEGNMTLELKEIISRELHSKSIKGTFEPRSMQCCAICVQQTHRWGIDDWVEEQAVRSMRYDVMNWQTLKFYYCLCHPTDEWWFQIDLYKQ